MGRVHQYVNGNLPCVVGGLSIRVGGSDCCLVMCVHGLRDGRAIIIMITYVFVSVTSVYVCLCIYVTI